MTIEVVSSIFEREIAAPYPGLRPFQPHESSIFFGRDEHVADMLTILENHRFLAVVGPSGGGKSSLVLAGLLPALQHGALLTAQPGKWRFVILRPGDAPLRKLAEAAQSQLWFDEPDHQFHDADPAFTELILRGSPFGFVDVLQDAAIPQDDNILLLVDQFEELFRFRTPEAVEELSSADRRNDAAVFVELLLQTAKQNRRPVYVMLTMRTDFLGDCDIFDGLPQLINQSQYLTPRLNLQQLAEAITRPVAAGPFHGSVNSNVVQRILNDVGTARDELPLIQHVLFRTWAWRHLQGRVEGAGVHMTLDDYEIVGGLKNALSRHAAEALAELKRADQQKLVQKVFRALCTRSATGQPMRRPATIAQIAAETGATSLEVAEVIAPFRNAERSFLVPAGDAPLDTESTIDISHESLLRQWTTLREWVDDEAKAAAIFTRLSDAAKRWPEQEPLLRNPALGLALEWKETQLPTTAWAQRYGGDLAQTLTYLDASDRAFEQERLREIEENDAKLKILQAYAHQLKRNARLLWIAVAALVALCAFVGGMGWYVNKNNKSLAEVDKQKRQLASDIATLNAKKGTVEFSLAQARNREKNQQVREAAVNTMARFNATISEAQDGSRSITFREGELDFKQALPHLANLGNVQTISLSRTMISDQELRDLGGLPTLRSLDLSHSDIGDTGIAHIAAIQNLVDLHLNDTRLTNTGLVQLRRLTNLKTLDISRTRVTPKGVAGLRASLPGCTIDYKGDPLLEALAQNNGNWNVAFQALGVSMFGGDVAFRKSAITDSGLKFAAREAKLEELTLHYCPHITDDGFRELALAPRLQAVQVFQCPRVSEEGIIALAQNPALRSLDISNIAFSDAGLEAISRSATKLRDLDISGRNTLTDANMKHISRFAALERLAIGFTDITEASFASLAKLKHLHELKLMSNDEIDRDAYGKLQQLPGLRILEISLVILSDENLVSLEGLKHLDQLNLYYVDGVSSAAISRLRAALPNTQVTHTTFDSEPDEATTTDTIGTQ